MQFNMTQAAKLADVSRRTFYNHIDSKKISIIKGDDGERFVEQSELERVYGKETILQNLKAIQDEEKESVQGRVNAQSTPVNGVQNTNIQEVLLLKQKIEALEKANETLEQQTRRERELAQEEKEYLRESLQRAQETQNKLTLLLEDKSSQNHGTASWEQTLRGLENRISNQEKSAKEKEEREQKILRQNQALKKAYEAEKKKAAELAAENNKSLWQKLFG